MTKVFGPRRKTRLTHKERGFIRDYIKTENGTLAALRNYEIGPHNRNPLNTAASIATENLQKPHIIKSIAEALPDSLLAERHLELLNKREVITAYREGKEGKEVIDSPDTQAVTRALDMAYKVKGSYAPEKRVNLNLEIPLKELSDEELAELAYNEENKEEATITSGA